MKPKQIWDDARGSALVEFTVTVPLFLLLTFGLLQAGLLLFTQAGLQHGVEVAARCASVNYSAYQLGLSQSCFTGSGGTPTPSTVVSSPSTYVPAYAAQNSWGINPATATSHFTVTGGSPTTNTCGTTPGYKVSVSYTYNIINYLFHPTLTAQSCFPINIS
jgi:Flp pilus assembly protein TadG